jgi:hypothetical protein
MFDGLIRRTWLPIFCRLCGFDVMALSAAVFVGAVAKVLIVARWLLSKRGT